MAPLTSRNATDQSLAADHLCAAIGRQQPLSASAHGIYAG